MRDYFDFSGKVILITGSTRGIGNKIARLFAECAANVIVNGRNPVTVEKTVNEINGGEFVYGIAADVGNEKEVEHMFNKIKEKYGHIDIVINNAALRPFENLHDIDKKSWDCVLNTNLTGTFNCIRAAMEMERGHKCIFVNISSICATTQPDYYAGIHYSASKGGVISLTRSLAMEFGRLGVRANSIVLGPIDKDGQQGELMAEYSRRNSSLGRPCSVDEVASTCLFLASDMSSGINGESIVIGGY
ncbi:MAG: SDR family oxidoreductase [Candidatus Paceibacterota bacterium]|jgi:NAD(P)-dependent dehydrogenase (short-subunit alcohol dehydrogenase family)